MCFMEKKNSWFFVLSIEKIIAVMMVYEFQLLVADSIMMLVKFRTSANQKH